MSDLTLPGDIKGLLRRGSPVVRLCNHRKGAQGLVWRVGNGLAVVTCADETGPSLLPMQDFALDLTDATGRVHSAWWVRDRSGGNGITRRQMDIVALAESGRTMSPEQTTTLRLLVLHVAGRSS